MDKEYCLTQDDDGHWYIIGINDKERFEKWVESTQWGYKGEELDYDFQDCSIGTGPSWIAFKEWRYI